MKSTSWAQAKNTVTQVNSFTSEASLVPLVWFEKNHKLLSFIHTLVQQILIKYLLCVALEVVKQTIQTHSLNLSHLNFRITDSDSSLFPFVRTELTYQTCNLR